MKTSYILAISLAEEKVLVKVTRGQSQLLDSLGVTGKTMAEVRQLHSDC
ncbi:MAG: hypothetical protein MJK13_06930 [Pseudomonadales bacterium]|nr:hypothetical protein [Pseudomonadales bacterium]